MSKAIYDLLNVVDRYVELTKLIYSRQSVGWDEVVEIQKKVKFILISSDFKSTLQDQILRSKLRSYEKLHELFLNRRNELENLINHLKINSSVMLFDPILTLKDKWFQELIDNQDKRLKVFDKEYKELNSKLKWSWYGIPEDDWKVFERNIENEKKILEPTLKEEREKLQQLYVNQRKFIHENSQYLTSYHCNLLSYMNYILDNSFIRSNKTAKREKINELIDCVKEYFETNTILNTEQNNLVSRLVEEIKTAFQNHNHEKTAEKIVVLTDKIVGYGEINTALSSQLEELKKLAVETKTNIDNSVDVVTNKLDDILENQIKDKKDYEELILEESLFQNSNLFYNIYILFANDIFEPIQRNSFVNIFQMHESNEKLKIQNGNVQNVYFILKMLSEHLEKHLNSDKAKSWLIHVINYIVWEEGWKLDVILDRIRKKYNKASVEVKEKLSRLIDIDS